MAAQLKASREALEQSFTALKYAKLMLIKAIKPDAVHNSRTLAAKLDKLQNALESLNVAHTGWCSKAELTEEDLQKEQFSMAWLETQWEEVGDVIERAEEILHTADMLTEAPIHTNDQKLSILSKQMESLQIQITSEIEGLSAKSIDDVNNSVTLQIYTDMTKNLKLGLESTFDELSQKILSLQNSDIFQKTLDEHADFRQSYGMRLTQIQLQLAEKSVAHTNSATTSHSLTSADSVYPRGIEMEKSRAPIFSGKTIDYPEFKRGWNKVAGIVWDDANQVEQIKLKVDTETRRIITRCKTMSEIWDALDIEYAQEQEVINAVDQELRCLKGLKCNTAEYIVKLRNHLPNLEDALNEVGGVEHLHSPDRVNFLAERFDERTMYEWEYFRSKNTGDTYSRFFRFLLDRYDACRSSIARIKSQCLNKEDAACAKCQHCKSKGHQTRDCHMQNHSINHSDLAVKSDCQRCAKWIAREDVQMCLGCGRGTHKGQKIDHSLEHCATYMRMSANERSDCVEKAGWCPVHLLATHNLNSCTQRSDPKLICGIGDCKLHHHKTLHGSTTRFLASVSSTTYALSKEENLLDNEHRNVSEMNGNVFYTDDLKDETCVDQENVLLVLQSVETISGKAICFFDNGSTCCLITNTAAKRLKLSGKPILITISTAIGEETIESMQYYVTLIDINGGHHVITLFGVDQISNSLKNVEIVNVKECFAPKVQQIWKHLENRPIGEVDILIGQNAAGLHPSDFEIQNNLKVMSSIFGSGYVLSG